MAEWYYSKNEQTFGPFTRKTMGSLIAKGEVTFVTLVWKEEAGKEGRGWVYAYETDLTKYFSDDMLHPSLPPVNQATAPESPVIMSGNPPPNESADASLSGEQGGNSWYSWYLWYLRYLCHLLYLWYSKKTLSSLKILPVIFVLGMLLGTAAAGYIFRLDLSFSGESAPMIEQALPAVQEEDSIVLKVSDMGTLRSLVFGLESTISSLSPGAANKSPIGENILPYARSSMGSLKDFLEAMDEMSILVVPSDDPAVYVSFIGKGGALDIFVSRLGTSFGVRAWDPNPHDKMTGWEISVPFLENPVLYVLKRPYGKSDVVYAARTEEDVEAMLSAARDETRRFITERTTSRKDFLQIKFPNSLTYGAIKKAFEPAWETQNIQTERADKVLLTMGETSWTKEGNILEYETYSDFLTKNPELAANMPKITQETKFLGDGELSCFAALDAGFVMKCVFPGSEDPVGETFKTFGQKQAALAVVRNGLKTILKNARLSAVCTEKGGRAQTAYLLLETDATESLNKFWWTYAPFAAMLGGEPIKLDGWNSAISIHIPFYGGTSANIILGHKRGTLLLGIGEAANFSKNVPLKREYQDYISPENVANIIVSPKFYDILLGLMDEFSFGAAMDDDAYIEVKNALIALCNSFQLFCGNLKPSGHANGKLVLTKGGDPTEAAFKLLSQIALAMPQYPWLTEKIAQR
ncbi:MAG: DUF4339 domain-containing protein [Synergistaceae bacterium]|jgi:hypothetical protein|nr:DUF4339 domain-containing protein [Synergistaceae bacterium]